MTIIALFLLIGSCVLALRYPPVGLAIYLMCATGGDANGVTGFFESIGLSYFTYFGRLILFSAVGASTYLLLRRCRISRESRRLFRYALVCIGVALLMGVTWYARGGELSRAIIEITLHGLPCAVVGLAYAHDQLARRTFVSVVFTQLFLAVCIVFAPGAFGRFSTDSFMAARGVADRETEQISGDFSRDSQERQRAQFYSATAYGLYASIGCALGCSLFFARGLLSPTIGGALICLGGAGIIATLSRSGPVGLVGASLAIAIPQGVALFRASPLRTGLVALGVFGLVMIALSTSAGQKALYNNFSFIEWQQAIDDRRELADHGLANALKHSFLGAPIDNFDTDSGYKPPHQLFLNFAEQSGVIPGFFGLFVMLYCVWEQLRRFLWLSTSSLSCKSHIGDVSLSVLFLAVLFVTTFFNNYGCPNLFWLTWGYCVAVSPLRVGKRKMSWTASSTSHHDE
ncbi:O-antigen ligase family protein [Allorhodopirellula heiligendammensis]|uniref:O-Antigen ligase n=1 Tax=Allorhodopirellula heiligendammensis TaxID=2714739 RepID=A0A5C6C656_9BACT|nr:hypothetical protein [Allorhodopirellula heiligendammensis]TWU18991.1 hypothetical protein Poly21_11620 [Allorhodopirellula heiligendammensis]